ncbi:MAG: large subunit ribosomal protein L10 [Gammaproteobacteria bacterium]|nr:MAG: large subunit ribosomal protein L10 [Gammaproteobacteria bacterium]TND01218.1 MAG: large subunit ribosomal protein L10 [Gammaproteobacteria bacterium]
MLTRKDKQAIVEEVAGIAARAQSAIAADYRGLSVAEMTELRAKARAEGVTMRVVKNTLARRALEGTEFSCMSDGLVGPLILAFSLDSPSSAARVFSNFVKDHVKLQVKVIALGGKLLDPSELKALASMPTRDEAISILMAVMKAPIEKLARTLAAPSTKLVRTLVAVRDAKQAA